jgi:hypothetical protein
MVPVGEEDKCFIAKPYTADSLTRRIREALEEKRGLVVRGTGNLPVGRFEDRETPMGKMPMPHSRQPSAMSPHVVILGDRVGRFYIPNLTLVKKAQ